MGDLQISCMMPTTMKRRRLLPASLRTFARQTYQDAQLVIGLDNDGGVVHMTHLIDTIGKDLGIRERIRIVVVEAPDVGSKRNRMIEQMDAPWIAFWDDDDWHHPSRLEHTASTIERVTGFVDYVEPMLLGSPTMLIHEIIDHRRRTYVYRWGGTKPYYVGGMLCFERRLWDRYKFPERRVEATLGDDWWWQDNMLVGDSSRVVISEDPTLYCAFIHKINTANTQAPAKDPNWQPFPTRSHPGDTAPSLERVLGDELRVWEEAHSRVLVDPLVFMQGDNFAKPWESA